MSPPRICHIGRAATAAQGRQALERACDLGFDTVVAEAEDGAVGMAALAQASESRGLALLLDLNIAELDPSHPLVKSHPECFAISSSGEWAGPVDPRQPPSERGLAHLRRSLGAGPVAAWWSTAIETWIKAGVRGFRIVKPASTAPDLWRELIPVARSAGADPLTIVADTAGEPRDRIAGLIETGFDYCLSSLPWWDGRASWFAEEYRALARVAPVVAQIESPTKLPAGSSAQRRGRLALAAATGTGVLMPLQFANEALEPSGVESLGGAIRAANEFVRTCQFSDGEIQSLTGPGAPLTILIRGDTPDLRDSARALVAMVNPDPLVACGIDSRMRSLLGEWNDLRPVFAENDLLEKIGPGEVRVFWGFRKRSVRPQRRGNPEIDAAIESPRVVVENVSPAVDAGAFAAKAIVGERMTVEADIYTDGHPVIAAELQYKLEHEQVWRTVRMHPIGNDRWQSALPLDAVGSYGFAIEAWIDTYGSFAHDLRKKRDAGLELALESREGQQLIEKTCAHAPGNIGDALRALLRGFDSLPPEDRIALLLAPETADLMHKADSRPFKTRTAVYPIEAERRSAGFGSWYQLFPRSQTAGANRHGTLRDVIERLPAIRDMGFDVLYLPPIHPIGRTNRKGKNNALTAAADDPGSVYAIGSEAGGHDAIHPQLGTMEDFHALVAAAHKNGLEIALDFAIQTSPDHPWLKQHRGWFDWRADGSIKYAENPPKKYEDIVNVDFYAREAKPDLWIALRDVVLFWIGQGVKIFRVDNPHTKPFAFWQWTIADIRGAHPDVIFLSEAFTRPKVMYRLAKLGFSQSYTYFTWRSTKHELTAYMEELTSPPVSAFFRPHFFVNTPDINSYFLQTSGRAGFLIRAALAATLSGLWGMYSGFELCEAAPLPGREEYLDSEKYEIKVRNWDASGNIIAEIAQLNRLRRAEPALQSHLGLAFYNAFNGNILYYGKMAPGHADRILVAVSLDPHNPQEADFEIPLWEWGLADHDSLSCEDLLTGNRWIWRGKIQHMRLTPDRPYAIWRIVPAAEA